MLRAFLAACAVGVIALTLILGVRNRPTIVISLPAPPPLSRSVAAPVLTAPPRVRVVTQPRTVVAKQHTVRLRQIAQPQFAAQIVPAKRTRAVPAPPLAPPTTSKPSLPPVTNTPAPTTPTTPAAPTPAPPVVTPASPPVDTTPSAPTSQPLESPPETTPPATTVPPPVVTPPAPPPATDTRPGNGWGDKNHEHTGPPGHGNG